MKPTAKKFIELAEKEFGVGATISRDDINVLCKKYKDDITFPFWFVQAKFREERGNYKLPDVNNTLGEIDPPKEEINAKFFDLPEKELKPVDVDPIMNVVVPAQEIPAGEGMRRISLIEDNVPFIPEKFQDYVPFGFFKDLKAIVKTGYFLPVFVTGWSGNGKTLMAEQVCADLGRECIRVNISPETDQNDLLGSVELIHGNTVFRPGPVLQAMKRGAILLLDEVDRGSNKLLCLQSILEGKPYYNKATGEIVHPSKGFNVIATANTKGKGSDDGRYLSQILDDAFLERFGITFEQEFPATGIELKIVVATFKKFGVEDDDFANKLVTWADLIRKSQKEEAVDELVSTRRLVNICQAYGIFRSRRVALEYCLNRFDAHIKNAFFDLYKKVDEQMKPVETPEKKPEGGVWNDPDDVPF